MGKAVWSYQRWNLASLTTVAEDVLFLSRGSEEVIDVDTVVVAIGQTRTRLSEKTTKGLDTNKRGCIIADEETGKTSKRPCICRR